MESEEFKSEGTGKGNGHVSDMDSEERKTIVTKRTVVTTSAGAGGAPAGGDVLELERESITESGGVDTDEYWDSPTGEVYYSLSHGGAVLGGIPTNGGEIARLDRTQEELGRFRRRIDASVQQQREYTDMVTGLKHKLEEYRRRAADTDKVGPRILTEELPTLTVIEPRVEDVMIQKSESYDYQVAARLEEDRRRNEEYYSVQLEQERLRNEQLRAEIENLRQRSEANLREQERAFQERERSLNQHISEEQRKLAELAAEFQRVRADFADHSGRLATDMERQRLEFLKVLRDFTGMKGGPSGEGRDLDLQNILSGAGGSAEMLEAVKRFKETGAGDSEFNAEIMKKYEESVERLVLLEAEANEFQRRQISQEAELRELRAKLADNQSGLRKLRDLAEDAERRPDQKGEKPKRDQSPGTAYLPPIDVVRVVRSVIRNKDADVQQLTRRIKIAENEAAELSAKYDATETARQKLEDHFKNAQAQLEIEVRNVDDLKRKLRRMDDLLKSRTSERDIAEQAKTRLEEQLNNIRTEYQKTLEETKKSLHDEYEVRIHSLEEDFKSRIAELNGRIDVLQRENRKLKADLDTRKATIRDLESKHKVILHEIEEKDQRIKHLEDQEKKYIKEIEDLQTRYETASTEIDRLNGELHSAIDARSSLEIALKEIKPQRDQLVKEKEELTREVFELRQKLDTERAAKGDINKEIALRDDEINKLKEKITIQETEIQKLRKAKDDLDSQGNAGQTKINNLQTEVTTVKKEVSRLIGLNDQLTKDNKALVAKTHELEGTVTTLRQTVSKYEVTINKITVENKELNEKDQKMRNQILQLESENNIWRKQVADAKTEVGQYREQIDRIKLDYAEQDQQQREVLESEPSEHNFEETDKGSVNITLIQTKIKEVNDGWKTKYDKLDDEKAELEVRIKQLESVIKDKEHALHQKDEDIDDLMRKHDSEIARIRADIMQLNDKHQIEIEDERDRYNRDITAAHATESELRTKLATVESQLTKLNSQLDDLENKVKDWQTKYQSQIDAYNKLQDELDNVRADSDRDIQKWKTSAMQAQTELNSLKASTTLLKTQFDALKDTNNVLSKTNNESTLRIRDLETQVRRLEDENADIKVTLETKEKDVDDLSSKLHDAEDRVSSLQVQITKVTSERDALKRDYDLAVGKPTVSTTDVDRLKKKVVTYETTVKDQRSKYDNLEAERNHLVDALREKTKQIERFEHMTHTFESKLGKLRAELQAAKDRLSDSERTKKDLRSSIEKLTDELTYAKETLQRKTDEYRVAMEDLSNFHRLAEEGRVKAVQELDTAKFTISDLQARLESAEQQLSIVQQQFNSADQDRDMLSDALRRVQGWATRVNNIHKLRWDPVMDESGDLILKPTSSGVEEIYMVSETTTTTTGGVPTVQGDIFTLPETKHLDMTLNSLFARIVKLEKDREEYLDTINRFNKKATGVTSSVVSNYDAQYKVLKAAGAAGAAADHQRALESRLTSVKQIVRAQEEVLKQRDDERRTFKAKLVAIELEARSKDAQIRHLGEELKALRRDLENSQLEVRNSRTREEQLDSSKFKLESQLREKENEAQRLSITIAKFEAERKGLNDKIKELSDHLREAENKNADIARDMDRLRREASTTDIKLITESKQEARPSTDYAVLRDQLSLTHSELMNANNRRQQVELELNGLRAEFAAYRQRMQDQGNRVAELERQLRTLHDEKNRAEDKAAGFERTIAMLRTTEVELRQQLGVASNDKASLQNKLNEYRRKLSEVESHRKRVEQQLQEAVRDRTVLLKRIEVLENEKRRADIAINETSRQREAIEKSLNEMERENKDLYKSCDQLNTQIQELEIEHEARIRELAKQREEQDRALQRLRNEKTQVHRLLESSERSQINRIRQLESALAMTQSQLDAERRRGHQFMLSSPVGAGVVGSSLRSNVFSRIAPASDYDILRQRSFVRSSYGSASSIPFATTSPRTGYTADSSFLSSTRQTTSIGEGTSILTKDTDITDMSKDA